jgi:hypothetical protein
MTRRHSTGRATTSAPARDPRSAPTLGACLRERRLAHRRDRLRLAILALRARVRVDDDARQTPPAPLLAAIAGFEQELAEVTAELQALERPGPVERPAAPLAAA